MKRLSSLFVSFIFILTIATFLRNSAIAVNDNKITICHATDSQSNPYVTNQPDKSGDVSGHNNHNGPVWFSGIVGQWGDIIPPFDYGDGQHYAGKNWTSEGQAIWNNGCTIPTTQPTPTNSPTPTPTNIIQNPCDGFDCLPTIVIPTFITPTAGPGNESNGNIDLCAIRVCPPSATPTPSPTPTSGPTPTNTPSNGGTGGTDVGSSSSSSSSQGQILGTNSLATTGVFTDTLMNAAALAGLLSIAVAAKRYVGEKK